MKKTAPILTVLLLWGISFGTTALLLEDTSVFSYLAPVHAITLIGAVFTLRHTLENHQQRYIAPLNAHS